MSQHAIEFVVPILAIIIGLVIFYGSKDKNASIGLYVFACGFFILLWVITFGGALAILK